MMSVSTFNITFKVIQAIRCDQILLKTEKREYTFL